MGGVNAKKQEKPQLYSSMTHSTVFNRQKNLLLFSLADRKNKRSFRVNGRVWKCVVFTS